MNKIKADLLSYKKLWFIELLIYLIIWFFVFTVPVYYNHLYGTIFWENVHSDWIILTAFLLIFIINVYFLVPSLLFKKKYAIYFTSCILICLAIIYAFVYLYIDYNAKLNAGMPPMEISPDIPMELSSKMPLPKGFRPDSNILQSSNNTILLNNFLVSILIIVASSSLKLFTRWISEDKRVKEIEQQQLKNELIMLRNQVSPHFLMNTLNNIYALVDINSVMAKDAVIRLSTLMRYMLYDTGKGQTSLVKEIEFIKSYFSLMKLRFSNNIELKINIPEEIPDIQIAPMLIITFLENAFKHGVSYNEKSYITFDLDIRDGIMHFSIRNSIHKKVKDDKYSGIGLANVKKSLELLYQDNYCLIIKDDKKEFLVDLSLPAWSEKLNRNISQTERKQLLIN